MCELSDYIMAHTDRGECQCGRCFDKGNTPDPKGHTADVMFFLVCAKNDPDLEKLRRLTKEHHGEFGTVNVLDGEEHGYIELGGWLGSQDVALRFMGLGSLLEMFDLMTPKNMLPKGTPNDLLIQLATSGMVTIRGSDAD